jgi:hypothetical protein
MQRAITTTINQSSEEQEANHNTKFTQMCANLYVSTQSSQGYAVCPLEQRHGMELLTLVSLVAQSCDRDDENNKTSKGNDNSEHQAITPRPIIKSPISTQLHLPTHLRWPQTVRKLLRSLSKGFVRDEEMLDLNITITELQDPLVEVLSVAVTTIITAFFRTKAYHSEMRCLDAMGFQQRAGRSKSCGAYISALLVDWAKVLAKEAGDHVEVLR